MSDCLSVHQFKKVPVGEESNHFFGRFNFWELNPNDVESPQWAIFGGLIHSSILKLLTGCHWKRRPVSRRVICFASVCVAVAVSICFVISKYTGSTVLEQPGEAGLNRPWIKASKSELPAMKRLINRNIVGLHCLSDVSNLPQYTKQLKLYGSNCSSLDVVDIGDDIFANVQIEEINVLGPYKVRELVELLQGFGENILSLEIDVDSFCGSHKRVHEKPIEGHLALPSLVRLSIKNSKKCGLGNLGMELSVPMLRHLKLDNSVLNEGSSAVFSRLLDTAADSIETISVSHTKFPSHFRLSPGRFPNLQVFEYPLTTQLN